MPFCPYCKEIVGANVTECPSCGMSWSPGANAPAEPVHTPPRIVAEQPMAPQQPAYQQPQYQQQPAYPQQPQYQQPTRQPAYQPPPQQPFYQQPPQQYAQPQYGPQPQYRQPYPAPVAAPKRMVGGVQMTLAMVGGIMGLIAAFMLFYTSTSATATMSSVDDLPSDYAYGWLIPVFGILAMLFAIIAFAAQNKVMGTLTGVLGILLLILPAVLAFHISSDSGTPIIDIFYYSESTMGWSVTMVYLGGMMAMLGGILATTGGFGLAKKLSRVRRPAQPRYY
ncbi:MAG: hypothetical protein R6W91_01505 [Thermoplasmata archaeon]